MIVPAALSFSRTPSVLQGRQGYFSSSLVLSFSRSFGKARLREAKKCAQHPTES